jgi:putative transcriptional regulator
MKKATDKKKTPRRDNRVFNGILAGLKEVAAHKRGEIKLNSYLAPSPVNVKAIRNKVGLSQSEFSARYGFPIRTLQDWELGRNQPPSPVRCYLLVIEQEPRRVEEILRDAGDGPNQWRAAPRKRGKKWIGL